jgi:hypothetical protein
MRRIPFIVKDANGQSLAYVYADNRQVVNTLTEDEARRIAAKSMTPTELRLPS